jgi:hypothetical protein
MTIKISGTSYSVTRRLQENSVVELEARKAASLSGATVAQIRTEVSLANPNCVKDIVDFLGTDDQLLKLAGSGMDFSQPQDVSPIDSFSNGEETHNPGIFLFSARRPQSENFSLSEQAKIVAEVNKVTLAEVRTDPSDDPLFLDHNATFLGEEGRLANVKLSLELWKQTGQTELNRIDWLSGEDLFRPGFNQDREWVESKFTDGKFSHWEAWHCSDEDTQASHPALKGLLPSSGESTSVKLVTNTSAMFKHIRERTESDDFIEGEIIKRVGPTVVHELELVTGVNKEAVEEELVRFGFNNPRIEDLFSEPIFKEAQAVTVKVQRADTPVSKGSERHSDNVIHRFFRYDLHAQSQDKSEVE